MQVYPCEKTKLVHLIHSSLFTSAYNTPFFPLQSCPYFMTCILVYKYQS